MWGTSSDGEEVFKEKAMIKCVIVWRCVRVLGKEEFFMVIMSNNRSMSKCYLVWDEIDVRLCQLFILLPWVDFLKTYIKVFILFRIK